MFQSTGQYWSRVCSTRDQKPAERIVSYLWYTSVLDTVGWVTWPVKIVPNIMTYNVFGGTLNPALLYSIKGNEWMNELVSLIYHS